MVNFVANVINFSYNNKLFDWKLINLWETTILNSTVGKIKEMKMILQTTFNDSFLFYPYHTPWSLILFFLSFLFFSNESSSSFFFSLLVIFISFELSSALHLSLLMFKSDFATTSSLRLSLYLPLNHQTSKEWQWVL